MCLPNEFVDSPFCRQYLCHLKKPKCVDIAIWGEILLEGRNLYVSVSALFLEIPAIYFPVFPMTIGA